MEKIYRISFQVYRTILMAILPLFFILKFMVGTAGHNSKIEIGDYLLIVFAILTPTLLTLLKKVDTAKIALRKSIRLVLIILIMTSIAFLVYEVYDCFLAYQNGNFESGDNIIVLILVSSIAISSIIIMGLINNKF